MKLESEEYPFCQLNETINLSPDDKILSKSLMINLRNQSPEVVYRNYLKLKQLIENPNEKPKNETKNNPGKKDKNVCPQCGGLMVEKRGISKKTGKPYAFKSCANWPACNYTEPLFSEKDEPSHEDLRTVFV